MGKIFLKKEEELFNFKDFIKLLKYNVDVKTLDGKILKNLSSFCLETAIDAVSSIIYDVNTDELVFIKQFRVGPLSKMEDNFQLEFVGGKIEKNISIEDNIKKEIKEEIGIKEVNSLEYISEYYVFPQFLSMKIYLFFAEIDSSKLPSSCGLIEEEGEYIEIEKIQSSKVREMLGNNELKDPIMITGLEWFFRNKK